MANITVIDSWQYKFSQPVIDYWRQQGHDVLTNINWGPSKTETGVIYFPVVDNNLIQASRKQAPSPDRFVVAEAVDIDIYAGHLGAVNWDYVNALVFMAHHKRDLAMRKSGGKIPKDLPIYIVPGGVDTDVWTYRRDPSRGYNVAWIGRLWVAKGVFSALQIFKQLIGTDPDNPWRLYLRADEKFNPEWYKDHVEGYLEANEDLKSRITWVPFQADLNEWLEEMDFILQSSYKEAYGYVVSQSAAKGIKPIVQMTAGALDTWPSSWVFHTHDEAIEMFLGSYEPETYRAYIADMYPLSKRCKILDEICGL